MRLPLESFLFRSIVLLSLIVAGSAFSLYHADQGPSRQEKGQAEQQSKDIDPPKTFVARTFDDPTAFFTATLAILTAVLAGVGVSQVYYLNRSDQTARISADAAKRSADIARDTLIASQRAWLKVDATLGDDPLSFDCLRVMLPICLKVKNLGNVIALNVSSTAELHFKIRERDLIDGWQSFAHKINEFPLPYGFSVFPGETHPENIGSKKITVLSSISLFKDKTLEPMMRANPIEFFFFVSVKYNFPSDAGKVHQTAFMLHVLRKDKNSIVWSDEPVPASDLMLSGSASAMFSVTT